MSGHCHAPHRPRIHHFLGVIAAVALLLTHAASADAPPPGATQQSALSPSLDHPHDLYLRHRAAAAPVAASAPGLPYSFDVTPRGEASATILSLGADVSVSSSGELRVSPTPSYGADTGALTTATWRYGLTLSTVGRASAAPSPLVAAAPVLDRGRVTVPMSQGVSLHYHNDARGLEQAITLQARPAGDGPLEVAFQSPKGFRHTLNDLGDQVLVTWGDEQVFTWQALTVLDATGRALPASMTPGADGALRYTIDDAKATYPLYIDPLASTPDATLNGGSATNTRFGYTVKHIGDVNNDGFDDVAVSQPSYSNGQQEEGRVVLFLGSAAGLTNTAAWAVESNLPLAFMGSTLAGGRSINGDAFDDLLIGAETAENTRGRVWLYVGQSNTSTPGFGGLANTAAWTVGGSGQTFGPDFFGDYFGSGLATGDFNCDGFPDVAVGSFGYEFELGRVQIFNGQAAAPFVSLTPSVEAFGDDPTAGGVGYIFGYTLATARLDADSCDDLLVTAPDVSFYINAGGTASAFLGAAAGLSGTPAWIYTDAAATPANRSFFGFSIAAADVNGDGLDDALVGSPVARSATALSNEGRVQVFLNSATGLSATPDWTRFGGAACAMFGYAITQAGDLNQDSFNDVVIGAPFINTNNEFQCNATPLPTHGGFTSAYLGSAAGLGVTAAWSVDRASDANARFGVSVSGGGDVNGDSFPDLIVGARRFTSSSNQSGAAFVFEGREVCFIDGAFFAAGDSNPTNPCLTCDPVADAADWTIALSGSACEDGNACTSTSTCQAGLCVGTCDDNNACTLDECVNGVCPATAVADDTVCEDNDFCSITSSCQAGQCVGAGDPCAAQPATDCAPSFACNPTLQLCVPSNTNTTDGQPCGDRCVTGGTCLVGVCLGSITDCSTLNSQCTLGVCDPNSTAIDPCIAQPIADNTPCADSDLCSVNDLCTAGVCAGAPKNCSDDNVCTQDLCQPSDGSCQNPDVTDVTPCGTAACAADSAAVLLTPLCGPGGVCEAAEVQSCDGFLCDPAAISCTTTCATDDDCVAPAYCDTNSLCAFDNRPPIADAGPDQDVNDDDLVTLNGANSADPDGDTLTYTWTQTSGPNVTLENADTATPSFIAPRAQTNGDTLTFSLTVNDGALDSAPVTTTITISNSGNIAPVSAITVTGLTDIFRADPGQTFTLSSINSNDPDGDAITYNWSLDLGPDDVAPTVTGDLTDADIVITIPDSLIKDTTYIFRLVVNDGLANSIPATHAVIVLANDEPPPDGDDTDVAEGDDTDVADGDDTADTSDVQGPTDPDASDDTGSDTDPDADGDLIPATLNGGNSDDCGCQSVRHTPAGSPAQGWLLLGGLAAVVLSTRRRRRR
jgi:hypothetical protein